MERDAELLDVSDIEAVWRTTREKLRLRDEEVRSLRDTVAKLRTSAEASSSELALLTRVNDQNAELREETATLKSRLDDVRREASAWTKKYETLEASMSDLKLSAAEETAARVGHLETTAARHEAAALRATRENRSLTRKYDRLKAKYAKLRARAKLNEREMDESARAVREVSDADAKLRSDVLQLRLDNRRLVQILRTCDEYARYCENFEAAPLSYLAETSVGGDASSSPWIHFDALQRAYGDDKRDGAAEAVRTSPKREMDRWIPRSILELTRDFHRRHLQHVSSELIRDFLRQINLACRKRERERASFVAKKYKYKIASLRRQIRQRRPYKEVVLEDRVAGLSHQLNDMRHEAAIATRSPESVTATSARRSGALSSSLAMVENVSREADALRAENARLRRRLDGRAHDVSAARTAAARGDDREYARGAAWVARNAEYLTGEVVERVRELRRRFRAQTGGAQEEEEEERDRRRVVERWAASTRVRLSPKRRMSRLLFDRIAYELASLRRRFRKMHRDASEAWGDRTKRRLFLRSLPLEGGGEVEEDGGESSESSSLSSA